MHLADGYWSEYHESFELFGWAELGPGVHERLAQGLDGLFALMAEASKS